MTKITKEITNVVEKEKRIYTNYELQKFGESLDKYMRDVELSNGEKFNTHDWETIYLKAGVKTNKGVVVQEKFDGSTYVPMIEFENKVEQWKWWKSGKQFGEEKKLLQLDEVAQQVTDEFNNW